MGPPRLDDTTTTSTASTAASRQRDAYFQNLERRQHGFEGEEKKRKKSSSSKKCDKLEQKRRLDATRQKARERLKGMTTTTAKGRGEEQKRREEEEEEEEKTIKTIPGPPKDEAPLTREESRAIRFFRVTFPLGVRGAFFRNRHRFHVYFCWFKHRRRRRRRRRRLLFVFVFLLLLFLFLSPPRAARETIRVQIPFGPIVKVTVPDGLPEEETKRTVEFCVKNWEGMEETCVPPPPPGMQKQYRKAKTHAETMLERGRDVTCEAVGEDMGVKENRILSGGYGADEEEEQEGIPPPPPPISQFIPPPMPVPTSVVVNPMIPMAMGATRMTHQSQRQQPPPPPPPPMHP